LRLRQAVFGVLAALLATAAVSGPWSGTLHGLSFDTLVWLRHAALGARFTPESSPVVVVAIDEETYRRPPFDTTPKVMWTRDLAPVIDAIADADAAVIGFDLILPTTIASQVRGYDTPFLQSLNRHARDGRLVLSKTQHSLKPILPAPGQRFAVGQGANIRSVNLFTEEDGIVRGVPVSLPLPAGGFEPSFAAELARRALGSRITFDGDGRLSRDGTTVPQGAGNSLLIDFDDTQAGIPTYSLADLHACAEAGNSAFFRARFAGRVVLFGSVLDVEDRKLTSRRFATAPDAAAYADRCAVPSMTALIDEARARDSLPGVYVHAFAINNLVRGNLLAPSGIGAGAAIAFAFALVAVAAAYLLPVAASGGVLLLTLAIWTGCAVAALDRSLVLPLFEPPLAAALAFALAIAYRIAVTDRDKRLLRQMFGYYLAPSIIEQMVDSGEMPTLGGENRELTIFFSDLAGFTTLSEGLPPDELVALLNEYLSSMTDIIETHGGFVDKYIGDAIVAIFGAPHCDTDHAGNALRAACACQRSLDEFNARHAATDRHRLVQRIGINTGQVVVGNIGSRRRFNYTVTGDAVNLASRLEGANKLYGTRILVSGPTAARADGGTRLREIDAVRVVGRDEAVILYEPDPPPAVDLAAYAAALALYRAGQFAESAQLWKALAAVDPASATMTDRASKFAVDPPSGWTSVHDLDSK
jgi:class 3 adenylate cyclase/CHASE2 domain-containing sensor protein